MEKVYIVLKDHEITDEIIESLGTNASKPVKILLNEGEETEVPSGYSVVSTYKQYDSLLKGYKKLTRTQLDDAINDLNSMGYYRNKIANLTHVSAFAQNEGFRARLKGTHKFTAPSSQTTIQDYLITEGRTMSGAIYKGQNTNFGDRVDFEVVHPILGSLDMFAETWYVSDAQTHIELYPAKLPAGLIIRVTYYNDGPSDSKFFVNLFLHRCNP